jgi:hypothetical protein
MCIFALDFAVLIIVIVYSMTFNFFVLFSLVF